jgi:SAM-dependent methyltransferase
VGKRKHTLSAAAVNEAFPKYPVTVEDKGWTYGVWYCGTSWVKVGLHGQYPPTFLRRALALFPDAKDILHCPSGTVTGPGVTVDLVRDKARKPQIVASADKLPFRSRSFDLILSDPPYTKEDSVKYGCPPFPLQGFMREAYRLLRVGGYLGMLHLYYPSYRRIEWNLLGLIAVVTGFMRKTRMFSILQKKSPRKGISK